MANEPITGYADKPAVPPPPSPLDAKFSDIHLTKKRAPRKVSQSVNDAGQLPASARNLTLDTSRIKGMEIQYRALRQYPMGSIHLRPADGYSLFNISTKDVSLCSGLPELQSVLGNSLDEL